MNAVIKRLSSDQFYIQTVAGFIQQHGCHAINDCVLKQVHAENASVDKTWLPLPPSSSFLDETKKSENSPVPNESNHPRNANLHCSFEGSRSPKNWQQAAPAAQEGSLLGSQTKRRTKTTEYKVIYRKNYAASKPFVLLQTRNCRRHDSGSSYTWEKHYDFPLFYFIYRSANKLSEYDRNVEKNIAT